MVKLLYEKGYVQLKRLYVDGTKIESRANRYTFVWRRAEDGFDKKLEEKVRVFIEDAKQLTEDENVEFGDEDLPEIGKGPISAEAISAMAEKLNGVIENLSRSDESKREVKKNSRRSTRD